MSFRQVSCSFTHLVPTFFFYIFSAIIKCVRETKKKVGSSHLNLLGTQLNALLDTLIKYIFSVLLFSSCYLIAKRIMKEAIIL